MKVREIAGPSFVVMAVTLWMLGCGETPTSPGSPVFKKGKPPTQEPKVTLANLSLASTTLTIGGLAVDYTVDVVNSGGKQTSVVLQGEIFQGNTVRAAGGLHVVCGGELGVLPHGTCPTSFTAQASNSTGGSGTLVPGAATLRLTVVAADGSTLALTSAAITLQ